MAFECHTKKAAKIANFDAEKTSLLTCRCKNSEKKFRSILNQKISSSFKVGKKQ